MRTAVAIPAFAIGSVMWIVGLSWKPILWLAIMGVAAIAVVQLWRLAARPIPTGGDQ